ncbi:carboxyl-terminal processing protease [Litorivivens lipolytica]|uniref:Carboxyl-terminal processing protease n=1 Tax=Litorivivens lipolytica TaxID=1524264 RepID=A0A7W4W2S3_9GAMM|nr:carboxy terminal-processing peptidase [Litorivivens lipolytica]MBB3046391.1 carboxyl-terminal processing protease [Litorivivens lipolytica]
MRLKSLPRFALLATAFTLAASLCTAAVEVVSPLQPTAVQAQTAKMIVKQLEQEHYVNLKLDDNTSAMLLDAFIKTLDPGKVFFLQSDINEFQRLRSQLDDELKKGELSGGFAIYNRYHKRLTERLQKTIGELPAMVRNFDFTEDEELELDRENSPWPANAKAADDLWRKQIKNRVLSLKLTGKEEKDTLELLLKRYSNQLSRVEQSTSEDVFQYYMNALSSVYDPHTDYFSPRISENFQINMSLKLEGIGAVLQSDDEYTKVVRLVPAGPADKNGQLHPADRIIAVAEGKNGEFKDVIGWRLDDVVDLIRGPKGTHVRLQVIPAESQSEEVRKTITIERNEVKLEEQSAQKEMIQVYRDGRVVKVGVISIPAFYLDFEALRRGDPDFRSSTRDTQRLLNELLADGAEGIIIDLRDNGGGSLAEANALTGLFIESGPTVQIRFANAWVKREGKRRSSDYYDGPLAVLINRMSASASEIFAGAIQDYQRGVVIGNQSFGKGTVQSISPLQHGQLKITESKFYRVSGESTQHNGVIPDIEFPAIYDKELVGESTLDNALPWDTIAPVYHHTYFDIESEIPRLRKEHRKRVSDDPDFRFLSEQLEQMDEFRNVKTLSLNEEVRRKQRDDRRKLQLKLENKRRIAKGLEPLTKLDADEEEEETASVDDNGEEKDKAEEPDPMLVEASHILVDSMAVFSKPQVAKANR